jgi:ATP-dependent DNA helicase RecG
MTLDELKARLKGIEWNDIEFKEAAGGIPQRIWKSVSAFSNTRGGILFSGCGTKVGGYTIQGIVNADDVQNGFVGTLRQKGKFSCVIAFQESLIEAEGQTVLVFFIPEVSRADKPVHIEGDLGESYVRRGGTTQKCNRVELEAFLRDASGRHYEDEPLACLDPATCFDADSLRWYRCLFSQKNPGHSTEGHTDNAFLEHFGLVIAHEGAPRPTRAAVLLFGTAAACNRVFSRQQVDFFRFLTRKEDCLPETRWDDRIETLNEGNLVKSWRRIIELWREHYHSGGRFELDATTMERSGAPSDYLAFREAVLNLLIHQDYGDQARKATIHAYTDTFEFWNPGASFVCGDEFFQPGDKPVRNPKNRNMLTRVGIGEQANTGIRNMYAHQRAMGWVLPEIENDPANHSFRLLLSKERSRSERQQALLDRLGVRLTDSQAAIFLHCWRRDTVTLHESQAVAGTGIAETHQDIQYLETQVLLQRVHSPLGPPAFRIPDHLREAHPVADLVPEVTPEVARLISVFSGEHSRRDLQDALGLRDDDHTRTAYILPALDGQWIEMTIPGKPQSRLQKYRLTKKARQWLADQARTKK